MIFMHGLGDSAEGGWSDVLSDFQYVFPGLKVILPNAPNQPVTLNGGMRMPSWHDIKSLEAIDQEEFKGLDDSKKIIDGLLDEEISSGTDSKKIILGGFSQGAALSLFTGLQYPKPLGGIVALSGYLPVRGDLKSLIHAENTNTPLMMANGEADQVVRFTIGQKSFKKVEEARPNNVLFKSYKNMGHHSSDEEMADIVAWMKKILV